MAPVRRRKSFVRGSNAIGGRQGKTTTVGSVEFARYIQISFRIQSGDTMVIPLR
jgi:hypothetical protein